MGRKNISRNNIDRNRKFSRNHHFDNIIEKVSNQPKEEVKRGKRYIVHVSRESVKEMKCGGCKKFIEIGVKTYTIIEKDHILGEQGGLDTRKHWHFDCWNQYR